MRRKLSVIDLCFGEVLLTGFPFCCCFLSLQSVIVKSVERNALNMYEARKCLLGLESSGVTIVSNPSTVSCPVGLSCPGLDILSSAGLGLTGLGMYPL